MSLIKAIRQQLGLSVTPANNFTLDASADNGTMKLARGNAGATTQDVMTVDAAGRVAFPQNLQTPVFIGANPGSGPISSNSITKVNVVSQADTAGWWNAGTTRYTPQVAGYYRCTTRIVGADSGNTLQLAEAHVLKNGSTAAQGSYSYIPTGSTVNAARSEVSAIVQVNGTTDYLEPGARVVGPGTLSVSDFYFDVQFVRAA